MHMHVGVFCTHVSLVCTSAPLCMAEVPTSTPCTLPQSTGWLPAGAAHRMALWILEHHLEVGMDLTWDGGREDDRDSDRAEGPNVPLGHLHSEPGRVSSQGDFPEMPPDSQAAAGPSPWVAPGCGLALSMSTHC